ncbi:MAG: glycosyltransferase family 4 protein [Legionella sp.]|uniref:glycosyltransferase family 4 protein n=1 Tax=Legionella sp. TaxID=459 RepID=UPI0028488A19|nr:glycosyltransferase family 4 protein [Legionella sp.]
MKILLISTRMGTAGVETLILRMAKFLKENNYKVDVLLMRESDRGVADKLRQYAEVYIGWQFFKTNKILKNLGKDYYDCIYTYSLFPLIYTMHIKQAYFPNAKICFGVYHPLEYCWKHKSNNLLARLAARFMKKFPQENIFFMNEGMKERHSEKLKQNFAQAPIIPIPVDLQQFDNAERIFSVDKPYKIVSIGRIIAFKTYNFTVLDTLSELIQRGCEVEYHVYGDGDQFEKLKELVFEKQLQNVVYLHGPIPYEDFAKVLKDAFLFIGVGTALVEAAACRVPCLQGIEMEPQANSYGFFHELTGYNLGEKSLTQPRYNMFDLMLQLMDKDVGDYKRICELSRNRAQEFDIRSSMQLFISSCDESKKVDYQLKKGTIFSALLNAVFWFFCRKLRLTTPFDTRYEDE